MQATFLWRPYQVRAMRELLDVGAPKLDSNHSHARNLLASKGVEFARDICARVLRACEERFGKARMQ
jgi:hypothetical protein